MGLDVKIITEDREFKFRACGIIYQNGKYLLVKIKDNPFYAIPGGHVELGENTEHAVLREMKEETGYDLNIKQLLAVTENFYIGTNKKKWHEIAYYYLMEPVEPIAMENKVIIENDKGELKKLAFYWWNPDEEPNIEMKPPFMKEKLKKKDFSTENIIICDD